MTRSWDFDYRLPYPGYDDEDSFVDVVIALRSPEHDACLERTLAGLGLVALQTLLLRPPLFWYRARFERAHPISAVSDALARAGVPVRYVTSSSKGSLALGERLDFATAQVARPSDWATRAVQQHAEPRSEGRWFLHEEAGIDLDRNLCGAGTGTRLAVIDDEARDSHALSLEREVLVGIPVAPRSALHGSLMVAWAVGKDADPHARTPTFAGVAPDASPRLYLIPRPGQDVFNLPLAVVRAVDDGADAVVCATHVEGSNSPLLDDALAFATSMGRGGRGTPVVVPVGREISSPAGALHSSLSLALGDLASDPRVLCVAPSGRRGGWFLWADRHGRLRPFANRGPATKVAAPGDDMAYPFLPNDRVGHSESSGASAIAAGVALLVLGTNPELGVNEVYQLLSSTTVRTQEASTYALADPADMLPSGGDLDGHDAKCGYGRLSATRACLTAADPVAAALVQMGEYEAARRYCATFARRFYSTQLGEWGALVYQRDAAVAQALRVVLRHLRLVNGDINRLRSQPSAAIMRQLALLAERFALHGAPAAIAPELESLRDGAVTASRSERASEQISFFLWEIAGRLWARAEAGSNEPEFGAAGPVGALERSA